MDSNVQSSPSNNNTEILSSIPNENSDPPHNTPKIPVNFYKKILIIPIILVVLFIVLITGVRIPNKDSRITPSGSSSSNTSPTPYIESYEDNVLIHNNGGTQIMNIFNKKTINLETDEKAIFSPEKKWVLFSRNNDLWKIRYDGTEEKRLTFISDIKRPEGETAETIRYSWSNDGNFIVYSVAIRDHRGYGLVKDEARGLWVTDAEGKNQKHITGDYWFERWIDSEKQMFMYYQSYEGEQKPFVYDIKSGKSTPFADGEEDSIFWNKEKNLGYDWDYENQQGYIVRKDLDGNLIKEPFSLPGISRVFKLNDTDIYRVKSVVAISPDGKFLLLEEETKPVYSYVDPSVYEVNITTSLYDVENKQERPLPILFTVNTDVEWTKDGKGIVYTKQYLQEGLLTGGGDLFYYNFDTKKETNITNSKLVLMSWMDF